MADYAKYTGISSGGGGGGSGITALTGDVTASGSGSVASTVAFVGGATAANVATTVTTVTAATSSPTVSTLIKRDANGNFQANNIETAVTSTVSAGSNTTLTVASTKTQIMTGSANQTFILPAANTLVLGFTFDFINTNGATGVLTIKDSAGTILCVAPPLSEVLATCTGIGSAAGAWVVSPQLNSNVISGVNGIAIGGGQFVGFGTATALGAGNYSLAGDGASYSILNVATGGSIFHRVANSTIMSMTSAGLDMGSHKITSVTDPTSAQDAATKNYVDTHGGGTPNSTIIVNTPNGHGSTGTFVRTWSNVKQSTGSDITYTADAVNGDSFTINTTGVYCFTCSDNNTSSTAFMGIIKNATGLQQTQNFSTFPQSQIILALTESQVILNYAPPASITAHCTAGDVITFQDDTAVGTGQCNFTNAFAFFQITRVS